LAASATVMNRDQDERLYGRRRGRPLRPGRQRLVETLLPRLALSLPEDARSVERLFPRPIRRLALEVGFGAGEHLAARAQASPDTGFIGCEPFLNGVASLLAQIDKACLDNIRVVPDDARPLIDALPDAVLDQVFVLFPDPWPKTRHHRRRFVGPANLDRLARVMKPGAELCVASDHPDYVDWILIHVRAHPEFSWSARGGGDWRARPADWPATRYEMKARRQGLKPSFLRFLRAPRNPAECG